MPSLENVANPSSGSGRVIVSPPPELDGEGAKVPTPPPAPSLSPSTPSSKPLTPADPQPDKQLSQEELAKLSIATQNVSKPTMSPHIASNPPDLALNDRVEKAKKAIHARWDKVYDWEHAPLQEALERLAELRAETERGGIILQHRVSESKVERVKCFACDNIINISEGRWAGHRTRNNFETGIPETAYSCSQRCHVILCRDFNHPTLASMAALKAEASEAER